MAQGDRAKLFEFYKMAFPFYRAQNPKANGKGLYFERLMMYGRGPCDGNQLEWNLSQYDSRPGVRRSMWQRSEEHTSELQSLMRNSYAVFCLKTKNKYYTRITPQ